MVNISARLRALNELVKIRTGPGAVILPPEITRVHLHFSRWVYGGHKSPRHIWRHYLPSLKFYNPSVSMSVSRTIPQKGPAFISIIRKLSASSPSTSIDDSTLELPKTLESFLHLHPAPADTRGPAQVKPNAPAAVPGMSQLDHLRLSGMPTDVPSLLSTISPMIPNPSEAQGESAVFINMLDRSIESIWEDFVQTTGATKVLIDPKDTELMEELERMEKRAKIDSERSLAVRAALKKEEDMLKAARESVA